MEDLDGFRRRVESAIKKAEGGSVALLPFLDDAQVALVSSLVKNRNDISASFYGGIIDSDRKRCIISSYLVLDEDYKINVYEIEYNTRYYELYHRSVLGSLMSLGIKRECIGDIVIDDKRVYFAASNEISKFLLAEFKNVGKAPIEIKEINYPVRNIVNYESKVYFLSSMRLDCVIAQAYNFSRSEVLEILAKGDVALNHIPNQNPSHILKENDLVSVRHKGRVLVKSIGGESRSGRLAVELAKRV